MASAQFTGLFGSSVQIYTVLLGGLLLVAGGKELRSARFGADLSWIKSCPYVGGRTDAVRRLEARPRTGWCPSRGRFCLALYRVQAASPAGRPLWGRPAGANRASSGYLITVRAVPLSTFTQVRAGVFWGAQHRYVATRRWVGHLRRIGNGQNT